jgi:hypothetical protein
VVATSPTSSCKASSVPSSATAAIASCRVVPRVSSPKVGDCDNSHSVSSACSKESGSLLPCARVRVRQNQQRQAGSIHL